jgi:hypothetical protein
MLTARLLLGGRLVLLLAGVVLLLRSLPPELRYRLSSRAWEQKRLAEEIERAEALMIAPRPRAALSLLFWHSLAWLVIASPLLLLMWLDRRAADPGCEMVSGIPLAYFYLLLSCYWLPWMFFFLLSSHFVPAGWQAVGGGFLPPLDTPVFYSTPARRGPWIRLRAFVALLLVPVSLVMVPMGWRAFDEVAGERSHARLIHDLRDGCAREDGRP